MLVLRKRKQRANRDKAGEQCSRNPGLPRNILAKKIIEVRRRLFTKPEERADPRFRWPHHPLDRACPHLTPETTTMAKQITLPSMATAWQLLKRLLVSLLVSNIRVHKRFLYFLALFKVEITKNR